VSAQLDQARDGWTRTISENPVSVIIYRTKKVDDGFGGTVENPFGEETPLVYMVRIAHEKKTDDVGGPGGIAEDPGRFAMIKYTDIVNRNDVFEAYGKTWRIESVDPIIRFSGVVGYRAKIIETKEIV
jgi:hypothetical protein